MKERESKEKNVRNHGGGTEGEREGKKRQCCLSFTIL